MSAQHADFDVEATLASMERGMNEALAEAERIVGPQSPEIAAHRHFMPAALAVTRALLECANAGIGFSITHQIAANAILNALPSPEGKELFATTITRLAFGPRPEHSVRREAFVALRQGGSA